MKNLSLKDLKVGNLIFQSFVQKDAMDQAIEDAHYLQKISHVGIITSQNIITEAKLNSGVIETDLKVFLQKGAKNWVYEFNQSGIILAICSYIKEQIGQPYNDSFLAEAKGYYCSELIIEAANYVSPNYFSTSQLNFYLPDSQTIAPFWNTYYKERNIEVPQGKQGSHPAGLVLQSQAISLIGTVFFPMI